MENVSLNQWGDSTRENARLNEQFRNEIGNTHAFFARRTGGLRPSSRAGT